MLSLDNGQQAVRMGLVYAQSLVSISYCCCSYFVTKSCLTLCNPVDCSPPSSSVHGISQVRILAWLPFPSPGDLPHQGIEPEPSAGRRVLSTTEAPEKCIIISPGVARAAQWAGGSIFQPQLMQLSNVRVITLYDQRFPQRLL